MFSLSKSKIKIILFVIMILVVYVGYVIHPVIIAEFNGYKFDTFEKYNNSDYNMYNDNEELYNSDFTIEYRTVSSYLDGNKERYDIYRYDHNTNIAYKRVKLNYKNVDDDRKFDNLNDETFYLWNNKSVYLIENNNINENKNGCYINRGINNNLTVKKYDYEIKNSGTILSYATDLFILNSLFTKQEINNSKVKSLEGYYSNKNEITGEKTIYHVKDSKGRVKLGEFNDEEVIKSSNFSANISSADIRYNIIPKWHNNNIDLQYKVELRENVKHNLSIYDKNWFNNAIKCYEKEYNNSLPNDLKNKIIKNIK